MSKPLLRIPYTGPLPPPLIIPPSAATKHGAITALANFLTSGSGSPVSASPSSAVDIHPSGVPSIDENTVGTDGRDGVYRAGQNENLQGGGGKTVLLTGAGISVASGLADYRGSKGTYTQNKSYRPIYFHEFVASHEARKRYWARSFLGWRGLHRASPNAAHYAVRDLGRLGLVDTVITQNVDSFHPIAHPKLPKTIELHGFLRSLAQLAALNPAWNAFLQELLASGALDTEDPEERRRKGFRTNPDGDADVPGAPYTTKSMTGTGGGVGILKPNVIMFGESIPASVKSAAEAAIDAANKVLVVGSSLATYSAWRLVKRAHERGMGIGVLNLGGVRKEEAFFGGGDSDNDTGSGHDGWAALRRDLVRASLPAEEILPSVVEYIRSQRERSG
ncbi:DHS-like NAD/FAD-binding domain-containing protein, partial [Aureobasidium melanogenum]